MRRNDDVKHRILLATIINHPPVYDSIEESFGAVAMQNQALEHMRQTIIGAFTENPDLDFETLQTYFEE